MTKNMDSKTENHEQEKADDAMLLMPLASQNYFFASNEQGLIEVGDKESQAKMGAGDRDDEANERSLARCQAMMEKGDGESSLAKNEEESKRRFENVSFTFKTDAMTFEKRLTLLRNKRDQAEKNVAIEVETMKRKIKELQRSNDGFDVEQYNGMSDLMKELDFVLKATKHLIGCSEAYGYVQHEGRTLELVAVMVQHVENVEARRKEVAIFLNRFQAQAGRFPPFLPEGPNERILRRKSTATFVAAGPDMSCRRRASIATLPETEHLEGCRIKKMSSGNGRPLGGTTGRNDESLGEGWARHWRLKYDSRSAGIRTKSSEINVDCVQAKMSTAPMTAAKVHETSKSDQLVLSDQVAECLVNLMTGCDPRFPSRTIYDCTKLMWTASRFRWPENIGDVVRFYATWTLVLLMCLFFLGGVLVGLHGCFFYIDLRRSPMWFATLALFILLRRFCRCSVGFALAIASALTALLLWFAISMPHKLSPEEVENLFRFFGLVLEVRYLHGPPPI